MTPHQTDTRSLMKFFVRDWPGACLDEAEVSAARSSYRDHVLALGDRIPESLRPLVASDGQSALRDGLIEKWERSGDTLVVSVITDDNGAGYHRVSLTYLGVEAVEEAFGSEIEHWVGNPYTEIVYDELDVLGKDRFEHRLALWPRGEVAIRCADLECKVEEVAENTRWSAQKDEWNPDRAMEEVKLVCELLKCDVQERREEGWEVALRLVNGHPENVEALLPHMLKFYKVEVSPSLIEDATYALSYTHSAEVRDLILGHSKSPDTPVRLAVARTIPIEYDPPTPSEIQALLALSADADDEVRNWATFQLSALNEIESEDVHRALLARLDDPHDETRNEAILGLARRGDRSVKSRIVSELESGAAWSHSLEAAAIVADEDYLPLLRGLQEWWDNNPELLEKAIQNCDPAKRAAMDKAAEAVLSLLRVSFDQAGVKLLDARVTIEPGGTDHEVAIKWVDRLGVPQESWYGFEYVLLRDDVQGDPVRAVSHMFNALRIDS